MKRLLTALAICTAAVVMLSGDSQAAETQTAFFQPRPGGVVDVITSPFRALTQPVSYRTVVLALLVTAGQEWDVPVVTVGLVTIMLAALEETVT